MALNLRIPELDGATGWLNSEPLTPADLRGHVVLAQFWTYTCINWLRTLSHVRAWAGKYADDGLIVLGIHTPEFVFEREVDNVKRAVAERMIEYPVVLDNDYAVWDAFANRYWPALYLVDSDGAIVYTHFGEGQYDETERMIQRLLGDDRELVDVDGQGLEAEADWNDLRSPETYLGYAQGRGFASDGGASFDGAREYTAPAQLERNSWALSGRWALRRDRVALEQAGGRIAYRFHARDVHLVLAPADRDRPVPFRVLLDGGAPGDAHGADVAADGSGVVQDARLYQLVRQPGKIHDTTFAIEFAEPGVEAFVFTFG
jgi:thiol-disulfide isomerase/thioredoxin